MIRLSITIYLVMFLEKMETRKTGANGVFLWENVELKRGVNALEARSDTSIDYADIRVL